MIFRLGRKNCNVKNEKWIVFTESQYVNSNEPCVRQATEASMSDIGSFN